MGGDDGGGKVENSDFWSLAENDLTTLMSGLRSQSTEYLLLIIYHFSCGSAGRTVLWISAKVLGSYVDDI